MIASTLRRMALLAILYHQTAAQFCNLCTDGGSFSNPNLVVPFLNVDENLNPTCQEIADAASQVQSGAACSLLQAQAAFCGCANESVEPVNACNLCANGASPGTPNLVTPFGDTCDELNNYVSFLDATECETGRVDSLLTASFLCGCNAAQETCLLCKIGEAVGNPDLVVPLLVSNS
jgi:hypothetical protein